jgi:hypothetical protein
MPKIKAFRVEYGTSVEVEGKWHKFYAAIEVEPDDVEEFSEVKETAWNTVYNEIEKQIREL